MCFIFAWLGRFEPSHATVRWTVAHRRLDGDGSIVFRNCDEAEFYDNDNGFALVAEYRNGELRPVGENSPQWLKELRAYLDN